MAIKRSVNIANTPSVGPVFNFREYSQADYNAKGAFHNNGSQIDFVTYNGNLYVCVNNGVGFESGNPSDHGFLLLVSKGADGRPGQDGARGPAGETPEYTLRFNGKQLTIIDQNGDRQAVSPDLTGPAWFPELHDKQIVWVKKEADDLIVPENIDLESLRPIEEHPILLRLDSDNTKRSDEESGPGYYIQWKREGNEEWTNLMSLSELMNIALAGVCFWWDDAEDGSCDAFGNPIQALHFGHKQVIKATYDSSKTGNKKIADVVLGDVLFDAGEVPFKNYDEQIADIEALLCGIHDIDFSSLVKSISVNNNAPMRPDENGNINITLEPGLQNLTLYTRDENGETWLYYAIQRNGVETERRLFKVPTSGNVSVINYYSAGQNNNKIATINGVDIYAPAGSGNGGIQTVNLDLQLGGQNGRTLQYKLSVDGNGSWQNGPELPAGGNADLTKIKLRIRLDNNTGKRYLEISRDGGNTWVEPLELPEGGSGNGLTLQEVETLISTYLNNYYTKSQIDALFGTPTGTTSYKPFSVYKRTNSNTVAPTKPAVNDWKWYVNIDNLLHSASNSNVDIVDGWSNTVPAVNGDSKYLWASWNTFESLTGTNDNKPWTDPECMTGADGKDGADGDSIKFIFKLASDSVHVPNAPVGNPPSFDNTWTDDAQGIDLQHKAEFYCYAKKTILNGTETWSAWQGPYLWSVYGEDGVDGAGVEYIYYATGNSTLSYSEKPSNLATSVINSLDYQSTSSEFVPKASDNLALIGGGTLDVDWTDNPTGVSSTYPYEFVSCRKFKLQNSNDTEKSWGPFSEPTVWAHFGQDGNAIASNDVIVPISTSVTATNEHIVNNSTVYDITGTITWRLSHNGSARSGDYCTVHLGSSTNGVQIFAGTTNNNGLYTATVPANTESSNLFLHIVWHDGTSISDVVLDTALVPVLLAGPQGAPGSSTVQGLDGPVMRVREWQTNTPYYDGNTPVNGVSYLDVVLYAGDYYKCISSITGSPWYAPVSSTNNSSDPEDWTYNDSYWERFAFIGDAAFNTMIANNAYIRNLTSKQIVVTDSNNSVVGGMTSYDGVPSEGISQSNVGSIRIWAGPLDNTGNLNSAPFTVDHDGVMKATKGYFGDGTNGIWIDGNGIVQFGQNVNIPTSTSQGYTIAVLGSSVIAEPVTNNNVTTYDVSGTLMYELYEDGELVSSRDNNCKAYLSGSGLLSATFSNGTYTINVNSTGLSLSDLFIQIIWYGNSLLTIVNAGVSVPIALKGDKGDPGSSSSVQTLDGPIMRLRDWSSNTDYRNGNIYQGESIAYLDVVSVTENDGIHYYKCTTSHTSTSSFDSTKWTEYYLIGDAAFNSLITNNAYINNLTSHQVVITDSQNRIVAGMTGSDSIPNNAASQNSDDVVLWAGTPTTSDINSAPFTVTESGALKATNATISGNLTVNSLTLNGVAVGPGHALNIAIGAANSTEIQNAPNDSLLFIL